MKMEHNQVIRFYTDSGQYKGWTRANRNTLLEIRCWLWSGNQIKLGKKAKERI